MGIEANKEYNIQEIEEKQEDSKQEENDIINFYFKMKEFLLNQTNTNKYKNMNILDPKYTCIEESNNIYKSKPILIPKPNHLR